MSAEWKKVALSEITLSLNTGLDAIRRAPIVSHPTDLRCLRIQDISQNKSIDSWGYTEVKDSDFKKYQLVKNDIIMARTCSTGINYLVKKDLDAVFNNGLARIRLNLDLAHPEFIYYVFQSKDFADYISGISCGTSVQLNMKVGDLAKFEFPLPALSEQIEIAEFLRSLDDKINLNRQINQTLEQIAQTIFKSWFVDFEPVKAKIEAKATGSDPERAAMCAISGKLEPELDEFPPVQYQQLAATAAMFPDELVESELGLIPMGWKVKTLAEMVQLIGGGTPKRSNAEFWGGDVPWFSVQDAPADADVFVVDTEEKITKFGLEKCSTRLLSVGTTIISARGTVGRLALVGVEMAMNQSCYGVAGADGVGPYFNYFNLKAAVSTLQQNTHGAVFDTITRQTFETVTCISPTKTLLESFEVILAPVMRTICNNVLERRTLATIRDVLLPKLLSGEFGIVVLNNLMEETE